MEFTCRNCGKTFTDEHHTGRNCKYCSRECYLEHISQHVVEKTKAVRPKVKVKCCICGKEEYVFQCRAKSYKTCSKECRDKHLHNINNQLKPKVCPVCGQTFMVKPSQWDRRLCCSIDCLSKWKAEKEKGDENGNSLERKVAKGLIKRTDLEKRGDYHQKVVKKFFGIKKIPSGYHVHHKDCNHQNNELTNLVVLPTDVHMLVHRHFGTVLLEALHTGRITREEFFHICNDKQSLFYKEIIDLDITHQAVVKQGELLESHEDGNQQPSVYRNIYEGSTTNSRVLASKVEDSNTDTSALPPPQ